MLRALAPVRWIFSRSRFHRGVRRLGLADAPPVPGTTFVAPDSVLAGGAGSGAGSGAGV